MTSSSCPDGRGQAASASSRAARRGPPALAALVAGAFALGAVPARAQDFRPFATASTFGTFEATNTSQVQGTDDGGQLVQDSVEVRSGYTIGAQVGVNYDTAETRNAAAYTIGISTSGDITVDESNILQGFSLQSSLTLGPRWEVRVSDQFFWGVFRVEQDLATLNLGGLGGFGGGGLGDAGASADPAAPPGRNVRPPTGATGARPPTAARPNGATNGSSATFTDPDSALTGAFAIHTLRFVRNDAAAGTSHAPCLRWDHALDLGFGLQYFLDRDIIDEFALRLFDTYNFSQFYTVTYRPNPFNELSLRLESTLSWFGGLDGGAADEPVEAVEEAGDSATTESVGGTLGWRHILAPRWFTEVAGGATLIIPLDDPESQQLAGTGAAALARQGDEWLVRLDVGRSVSQSELGAIYAVSAVTLSALGEITEVTQLQLAATAARQDALVVVLRPEDRIADFRPETLEGYAIAGTAQLTHLLTRSMQVTLGYGYDQRFSDDPEATSSPSSHRILVGLTIGTASSEVGREAEAIERPAVTGSVN